jgi:poly-beta-1,6-N-acetyl-D-glucosamine synthase
MWTSHALLAYVHLGYPILLELMVRRRRRSSVPCPRPERATSASATIIIAALDEEAAIRHTIDRMLALDTGGHDVDIVVVTDGSVDRTPCIARSIEDDRLHVLHESRRRGKAAAINRGAAAASGDILLFSDANNTWGAGALIALMRAFDDPEVGGATGLKTIARSGAEHAEAEGWYWTYESWIRTRESDLGSCTAANGEIMAVRAAYFRPIPEETVVDDLRIALDVLRQGARFVAVPDAVSIERATPTERDERERRARMAAGRARLLIGSDVLVGVPPRAMWHVASHKLGRLIVPVALITACLGACAGWSSPMPTTRTASRATVAGFSVAGLVVVAAPHLGERGPTRVRTLLRALRYLAVSNYAVGVGLVRALRNRQSAAWTRVAREPERAAA